MNRVLTVALCLMLAGCAGSQIYTPSGAEARRFQERAVTQQKGDVVVSAAVPDQTETLALTGLDLYAQGIQPVWLKVQNRGQKPFWVMHKSMDPDYFSPIEVAYMNRKSFSKEGQATMERWFWESQLDRILLPGKSMEGMVYTHLTRGTKGFNLEAVGEGNRWDMTFFIPMPGFLPDYMGVNFEEIYTTGEKRDFSDTDLLAGLKAGIPCCSSSEKGAEDGLPFSLVLVSNGGTLRRALFRAGWHETAADDTSTAAARQQHYRDRPPDGVFYKDRPDGKERKELRLWLTPYSSEGQSVIVAQVVHDLAGGESFILDPDLNAARNYATQSFWYGQSLKQISAYQEDSSVSDIDAPASAFNQEMYFSDGVVSVLWLSDSPVALDAVHNRLKAASNNNPAEQTP